jgi:hypothetical protein
MSSKIISTLTVLLTLLLCSCQSTKEDGFEPLFNEKDLTGWCYLKPALEKFDGKTEASDQCLS